jgi:hypothetical protein
VLNAAASVEWPGARLACQAENMLTLAVEPPLRVDAHGAIRIGSSRVTLAVVVTSFRAGSTETLDNNLVRGVRRLRPEIDIICVQDVGLAGSDDPEVLAWAAEQERVASRAGEWEGRVLFLPLA